MRFITRLLSVSALGLAMALAAAGAASAQTNTGPPNQGPQGCQQGGGMWGGNQSQCCPSPGYGDPSETWGMCHQPKPPYCQSQWCKPKHHHKPKPKHHHKPKPKHHKPRKNRHH